MTGSPGIPGDPGTVDLELAPFRGVRYVRSRVAGLAEVTSPPYDVIARDSEDQLMAADPHNVVRLILPRYLPGEPGGQYDHAAATLREWREQGLLLPDAEPGLYVYEQASGGQAAGGQAAGGQAAGGQAAGGTDAETVLQRGLIGAVRLAPPGADTVLPHEDVAPGPVAGRLRLMQATQANLEPIFLLYDGVPRRDGDGSGHDDGVARRDGAGQSAPGAAARAVDSAASRPPLLEAVTGDGIRHRLWAITDPAELAAVAADLAPRQALIADGHHRYAAYLELQARLRVESAGPGPWDYGLALLVDSAAYPPRIGAIHRVLPGLAAATAADLAKPAFSVRTLPGGTARLADALDRLAEASRGGPAFLVAGGGEVYLLTEPDPLLLATVMPERRSARWRSLAASVLQEVLLDRVWGIRDDEDSVRVVHQDAAAAVRQADEVPGGTAVICPPMLAADVYAIAAGGERVPRKSTSFGPKPRTGLIMRLFAEG